MCYELNQVDLAFVVDTTGSMGPFVQAAKRHLLEMLETISRKSEIDLHAGLVEYRDHPPEDKSFVTRVKALTPDLRALKKSINKMCPDGGGDWPEAVFDGVHDACTTLKWRRHAYRLAVLIGDAPPHARYAHLAKDDRPTQRTGRYADRWADGAPCCLDMHSTSAAAEEAGVTLFALVMNQCDFTTEALTELAGLTGGACFTAQEGYKAIETIKTILDREFKNLIFDGSVLTVIRQYDTLATDEIANRIECPPVQVAEALFRLGKRGLVGDMVTGAAIAVGDR